VNLGAGDDVFAGSRIDPRPILIVTGLVQEARIAAGPGMAVICSSSDPQQLRALLSVFDPSTIRGVISFGVAGGLDPSLRSGDVVVATEVIEGDARWLAGLALNEELFESVALGRRRVVRGSLAGAEAVVQGQSCKAALHLETGAVAVPISARRRQSPSVTIPTRLSLPSMTGRPLISFSSIKHAASQIEASGVIDTIRRVITCSAFITKLPI